MLQDVTKCYKCNMGFAYFSGTYAGTPPSPQGGLCKVRISHRAHRGHIEGKVIQGQKPRQLERHIH
jgi:hypothetical protein